MGFVSLNPTYQAEQFLMVFPFWLLIYHVGFFLCAECQKSAAALFAVGWIDLLGNTLNKRYFYFILNFIKILIHCDYLQPIFFSNFKLVNIIKI